MNLRRMDADRLPHFVVKYQPYGKGGNGNTSKDFGLLMGRDPVTRPNPLLLLLLKMMIMILYITEMNICTLLNSQLVMPGQYLILNFDFLQCVSSISYTYNLVRINQCDIVKNTSDRGL